ncbi:MAG TPA: S8 family serine peptidase [Thermoanaerobaculia bacterium]|jgi:subtilisin family serine protease|nr:S8 family serine peptidase [Thermoanaerobaculia bacterium]
MKRLVTFFFALALASTLSAATQRYIVATRAFVPVARAAVMIRDIETTPRPRSVESFRSISGFAADLSDDEAAALRRSVEVRYIEPVVERHALDLGGVTTNADVVNPFAQTVPFGIDLVRAREVWPVTHGEGINVVVIDTGIDYTHPDLAGVYAGGFNTYGNTDDPKDDNGHGTHVAGTIAAADNNVGVVGVAPHVKLWSVKVLNSKGSGSSDRIISALDWVLDKKNTLGGDWVINLSLGSVTPSVAEREAFGRAIDAGLLICAASGNESSTIGPAPVDYPAAYRDVLAIGAVDQSRVVAGFSNQGPELAVVAPGVSVLSTYPVGQGSSAGALTNAGTFAGAEIELSKRGTVTAGFVKCGIGKPEEFPASVAGKIAVIQRGELSFNAKAHNAVSAGAAGIIIYNNDATSALTWTLRNTSDPGADAFAWPVTIALTQADGTALVNNATGQITITDRADDYEVLSGTSMATPHAVGVAALVWSAAPTISAGDIRQALLHTAVDLGDAGFDTVYGNGMVDALSAAKQVAPAKFGVPSTPFSGPRTRAVRRH